MKIKEYSYRYAKEILEHPKYKEFYNEIIGICTDVPIPICKDKSPNQKQLDVVQQILNTYLKLKFESLGWESEPFATPSENEDSLRSDFKKTFNCEGDENLTVQIEVEFGNIASTYRNYIKFQLSFSYGLSDLCILITATDRLSKRIDSGVASYEKTVREIPSAKLSITVPILVIGLDDSDTSYDWDVYKEYCEKNGLQYPLTNKDDKNKMLEILKGSKKQYLVKHQEFIQNYIDRQN